MQKGKPMSLLPLIGFKDLLDRIKVNVPCDFWSFLFVYSEVELHSINTATEEYFACEHSAKTSIVYYLHSFVLLRGKMTRKVFWVTTLQYCTDSETTREMIAQTS